MEERAPGRHRARKVKKTARPKMHTYPKWLKPRLFSYSNIQWIPPKRSQFSCSSKNTVAAWKRRNWLISFTCGMADIWKYVLNSTVILPRFPLITGSNPSKRVPHDLGLNTHCTQNSICILEWTLGPSGDTSAGPPRCLLELGLRPLVADRTAFHLALEHTACFASASCKLSPGRGRGKPWARGSAVYRVRRRDWRYLNSYFLTQLWKIPSFFHLYLQH